MYHADPTSLFRPTQQLLLIKFETRDLLLTGDKVINFWVSAMLNQCSI